MILRHLVPELQDWNQQKRTKSIQLLGTLVGYVESTLGAYLEKYHVLKALSSSVKDNESKVVEALAEVGVVLGCNVNSTIVLALLVPLIYHETQAHNSAQTASGISGALLLLTSIIEGVPHSASETYRMQTLDELIDILNKDHIREAEGTQIQYHLLEVNMAVVEHFHLEISRRIRQPSSSELDIVYIVPLLRNLIQLMCTDGNFVTVRECFWP